MIAIIEPFPILRLGLNLAVKEAFIRYQVHEASSWDEFEADLPSKKPRLFILGIEIATFLESSLIVKKITEFYPDTDIVIYDGSPTGRKLLANKYLEAGAAAYLSKIDPFDSLIDCLSKLLDNRKDLYQSMVMKQL